MQLALCVVGLVLLILSIILCIVMEDDIWWMVVQLIGEVIAFMGYTRFETLIEQLQEDIKTTEVEELI